LTGELLHEERSGRCHRYVEPGGGVHDVPAHKHGRLARVAGERQQAGARVAEQFRFVLAAIEADHYKA
jgi:hypothetical protein